MGRLLIVRHGETPWNVEGRLQGHADIDISEKGRQQAQKVAKRLADTPIDVAYSSDLARAWHTAEIILDQRNVPLHSTEGLRERYYGVFEGGFYTVNIIIQTLMRFTYFRSGLLRLN